MPRHNHNFDRPQWYIRDDFNNDGSIFSQDNSIAPHSVKMYVSESGSNHPHNNLPTYIAVYAFRRTSQLREKCHLTSTNWLAKKPVLLQILMTEEWLLNIQWGYLRKYVATQTITHIMRGGLTQQGVAITKVITCSRLTMQLWRLNVPDSYGRKASNKFIYGYMGEWGLAISTYR